MKKVIGITGGISSGKSNVMKVISELGYLTISSDHIVSELSIIGMPIYEKIKEVFGMDYLLPNGNIDKQKLGKYIFSNKEARDKLNSITHPIVREVIESKIEKANAEYIFIEIPLLFEAKFADLCDVTVCVYLDKDIQRERLALRDNISLEEADVKINSQMPLEEKRNLCDYAIDSRGNFEDTKLQVLDIIERIIL